MAFGKKTAAVKFDQGSVAMMASDALKKSRSTIVRLAVRITGNSPLLMHRWEQKSIMQMVGKMVGQDQPRPPKDLTKEFEESYYRNIYGAVAMPCRIVKAAIIEGAISTGGVTSKAELKRGLRVVGYTAPIKLHGKPVRNVEMEKRAGKATSADGMTMDCRIASNNGSPDMRSRAVIPAGYYFDVVLQFATVLTPDKVVAALEGAGATIGLCEFRPANGGEYGSFDIGILPKQEEAIPRILAECGVPEQEYVIPPEFLSAFHSAAEASTSDAAKKASAVVSRVNGDAHRARGSLVDNQS